jgi:uncharacterized delta-60 repeat protein
MSRLGLALAILACAATTASAAPGAPGSPDRGFGRGGVATLSDPFLSFDPSFLALQPDGGVLVGVAANVPGSSAGPGFVLARFTKAGRVDPRFGRRGRVDTGLDRPRAAMLADGGFVVAGFTGDPTYPEITLRFFDRSGTPKARSTTPLPGVNPDVVAVAAETDGRVLVLLTGNRLYRFTAEGALEASVGSVSSYDGDVYAMAPLPDGRLLFAGSRGPLSGPLLARDLADGRPDVTFGLYGTAQLAGGGTITALAVARDGTIVATGSVCDSGDCSLALWRIRADGNGGVLSRPGELRRVQPGGIAVDAAGGAVLAGWASPQLGHPVIALRAGIDGRLDAGFGHAGRLDWPRRQPGVAGPVIAPDGRILLGMREQLGTVDPETEDSTDVAVVRLVRLWGGYDRRAPAIRARFACAGARTVARLRIEDRSRLRRLTVSLRGKRIRVRPQAHLALGLRGGGRLRVVAVDQAGNRASRTLRVPHCPVSG